MKAYNKGITLIAVVITIIILLILAGITISQLTENGLFGKAKEIEETQLKAEMKEQLAMAISELQIDKLGQATINDITQDWANEGIKDYESKVTEYEVTNRRKIVMKKDGITGTFLIDENLNIIELEQDGSVLFAYEALNVNGNTATILIHVQDSENGLREVRFINENDALILYGTKEEKAIDYKVEIDQDYKIVITSENGEVKEEIIHLKLPTDPIINESQFSYPILSMTGVTPGGLEVEINFDESDEFANYYSIDNGNTWNLYTGKTMVETGAGLTKIIAKSEYKKCPGLYKQIEKPVTLERDIPELGKNAYDDSAETGSQYTVQIPYPYPYDGQVYYSYAVCFEVDESTWWNELNIWAKQLGEWMQRGLLQIYDEEGTIIESTWLGDTLTGEGLHLSRGIPERSKKIIFYSNREFEVIDTSLKEINEEDIFWPTFESDMQNGVRVAATSNYYPSYHACDGNQATQWIPASGVGAPHSFQIDFKKPRIITGYSFNGGYSNYSHYNGHGPSEPIFSMQASNDGKNWINLEGDTQHEGSWGGVIAYDVELENTNAFKFYRFYFTQGYWYYGGSSACFIKDLILRGSYE